MYSILVFQAEILLLEKKVMAFLRLLVLDFLLKMELYFQLEKSIMLLDQTPIFLMMAEAWVGMVISI